MGRCCFECATLFKIRKSDGYIEWAKNLGFEVTAICRFNNKIYAAISQLDWTRQLYSYYDIIVLDLDGNVLLDECINVFPNFVKEILADKGKGIEYRKGIDARFEPFTRLHAFFDKDNNLYIIGVAGDMVYQIVNGKLKKAIGVVSLDMFFDGTQLIFISGEAPLAVSLNLHTSSYIDTFKIEIGDNYILYTKYLLFGYDYSNFTTLYNDPVPITPTTPGVHVLDIDTTDTNGYDKYVDIRDYEGRLYKYELITDGKTYSKFIFDENEFPLVALSPPTIRYDYLYYDRSKDFDFSNARNNVPFRNSSEEYAISHFGGSPRIPNFIVSKLNLYTFDYEFNELSAGSDTGTLESNFNAVNLINQIKVTVDRKAINKYDNSSLLSLDVSKRNGNYYAYETIQLGGGAYKIVNKRTEDAPEMITNVLVKDVHANGESAVVQLRHNNGLSCGWYENPSSVVARTTISKDDPNFILNFSNSNMGFNGAGDYVSMYFFYGVNGAVYVDIVDTVEVYCNDYLTNAVQPKAEAKLTRVSFIKNSQSYIKDGKIIFNAALYLGYTIYQDIYAVEVHALEGDSITFDYEFTGYLVEAYDEEGKMTGWSYTTHWPGYTETYTGFTVAYLPGDTIDGIDEMEYYDNMYGGGGSDAWIPLTPNPNGGDYLNDGRPWINKDGSVIRNYVFAGSGIAFIVYTFLPPILTDDYPLLHIWNHQEFSLECVVYGGKMAPADGVSLYKNVLISLDISSGKYDIITVDNQTNCIRRDFNIVEGIPMGGREAENLFETIVVPPLVHIYGEPDIFTKHPLNHTDYGPPANLTVGYSSVIYPLIYNGLTYQSSYEILRDLNIIRNSNIWYLDNSLGNKKLNTTDRSRLIIKDDNNNTYVAIRSNDGGGKFIIYNGANISDIIVDPTINATGIAYNYKHSTGDGSPSWKMVLDDILDNNVSNRLQQFNERFPYLYEKYDIANDFIQRWDKEIASYYDKLSLITDQSEYEDEIQKYPYTFALDLRRKGFTFNEILYNHREYFVDIILSQNPEPYPDSRTVKTSIYYEKRTPSLNFFDNGNKELTIDIDYTTGDDLIYQINNSSYPISVISNGPLIERPIILALPKDTSYNYGNTVITDYYGLRFNLIREGFYEKEKYNIICLDENGDVKWENNYLINPRPYTDFTATLDKSLGYTYNLTTYDHLNVPLELAQDNDYLYLGTYKRKIFKLPYIENSGELYKEAVIGGRDCGELYNPYFRDFLE